MSMMALVCGVCLGVALTVSGWTTPENLRGAAGCSRWAAVRTWLDTLGLGMALTAALCWLAVIDVDRLRVVPLTANVLAGGVVFGLCAGLSGYLPLTSLAGIGAGRVWESLCALAGCVLGAWLGTLLPGEMLTGLFPAVPGTLFRLTLQDPWLLDGGFASLACLGALLCAVSLAFRPPRTRGVPTGAIAEETDGMIDEERTPSTPDEMTEGHKKHHRGPTADALPEAADALAKEHPDDKPVTGDTADLLDGAPPSPSDVFIPPIMPSDDTLYGDDEDDPDK